MWIRWQRQDFCALPGHAALYWRFIDVTPVAFSAPVLAYIALRLARTPRSKMFSIMVFNSSLLVLFLAIHGLYWSKFW